MTTIKEIIWSDRNESTHVCDVITLSDGRIIHSWNGNASYEVYDKAHGRLEVGSVLVKEEDDESYHGIPFTNFHFQSEAEIKMDAIIAAAPKGCYHIKLWHPMEDHVVNLTHSGGKPFDVARSPYGDGYVTEAQLESFILSCDRVDYLVGV